MTVRIGGTVVAQSHYRIFIKMEEKVMEERDRMKILIAYDGSECAESAIDDLKRAGLPRRAEAIVLTIAEELFPAPTSIGGVATTFGRKRRIRWRWPGGRSREYINSSLVGKSWLMRASDRRAARSSPGPMNGAPI